MLFRSSRLAEYLESRTLFALTTFTIDSTLSSLRLSGNVADVFDIEQQHDGSLNQFYQGTIAVDITDNVISFVGDSSIVAQAQKKYDPGSALANYGMKGETGGPFSVKLGEAAIRNFAFDLTSTNLALSADSGAFGAGGLRVHTTGGKLDYDLRVGGDGSSDLDDETPDNNATGNATLRGEGDNRTLTIPVDFTFDAGSTELRFRGTLVATSGSGAPVDANDVRIGDGTLLKSVQFTDADGTLSTFTIAAGGTADVRFENAGEQVPGKTGVTIVGGQNVQLTGIDVSGTTSRTKLTITGKGGRDGIVAVPALSTDGAAAAVGGKGVAFTGTVTIGGALGTLAASRLTAASVTADSLGAVKIGGDVTSSTITLGAPAAATAGAPAVRRVSVSGAFIGSRITTAGAIGPVNVKTMTASEIYSGVADAAARFPATSDLAATGAIGNVTTKTFADSVIAGHVLGRMKFGQIVIANNGVPFGLTADVLGGLTAANDSKQRVKLLLTEDPAVLAAALSAQGFTTGDFEIRLAGEGN
jgi:hypothetical protein